MCIILSRGKVQTIRTGNCMDKKIGGHGPDNNKYYYNKPSIFNRSRANWPIRL